MSTIGAVYCVYDASTFLYESVYRIYPLMDMIVFSLNTKPWYGNPVSSEPFSTYKKILNIVDPDDKFVILTGSWGNEASQRNKGLEYLRSRDIDWCLIIDDDELYNRSELGPIKRMLNASVHIAFNIAHQIYWKNRNTIIDKYSMSLPALAKTDGTVHFNQNRMILIDKPYTWFSISADSIICHHMSYIRSDSEMLRKVSNFSHADEINPGWYEEKWLKWNEDMIDLHPTLAKGFKKAVSVNKSKYQLQQIF